MLLRARWFTLGMAVGSLVTLRLARTVRSVLPARLAPGDLADAWRQGRRAMVRREAELRGLPGRPEGARASLELVKPLPERHGAHRPPVA